MVLPIGPWGGGISASYKITNSLLFRGGQKIYRSFTSSSTWGFSIWVRRSTLGAVNPILGSAVKFNATDTITAGSLTTTEVYRDPTAWMHIAIAGGHLWVNGVDMGSTTTSVFTCSATNCLGYDGTNYLNAEAAEFAFIDGGQPSSAPGRIDGATGSWAPNPVLATWGTNGVYLGKPWNYSGLGIDYSGNGNTWTSSGFSASDVLTDSPTNVFATLNPIGKPVGPLGIFSNGNLTLTTSGDGIALATFPVPYSGKFMWEGTLAATGLPDYGIATIRKSGAGQIVGFNGVYSNGGNGLVLHSENQQPASDGRQATTTGDIGVIAVDATSGKVWIGRNRSGTVTWVGNGDPVAGTSPTFSGPGGGGVYSTALNLASETWYPEFGGYTGNIWNVNFGQRAFTTTLTGYKALSTYELPATTGLSSGSFTGTADANGPCIYTGAVPLTLSINGNAVTWGTHADKLSTGFKVRTSISSYNSTGANTWAATYGSPQKPTVGSNKVPATAQGN